MMTLPMLGGCTDQHIHAELETNEDFSMRKSKLIPGCINCRLLFFLVNVVLTFFLVNTTSKNLMYFILVS